MSRQTAWIDLTKNPIGPISLISLIGPIDPLSPIPIFPPDCQANS